jgi:hypothetical protein
LNLTRFSATLHDDIRTYISRCTVVVKVLCYKSEGRLFDSR